MARGGLPHEGAAAGLPQGCVGGGARVWCSAAHTRTSPCSYASASCSRSSPPRSASCSTETGCSCRCKAWRSRRRSAAAASSRSTRDGRTPPGIPYSSTATFCTRGTTSSRRPRRFWTPSRTSSGPTSSSGRASSGSKRPLLPRFPTRARQPPFAASTSPPRPGGGRERHSLAGTHTLARARTHTHARPHPLALPPTHAPRAPDTARLATHPHARMPAYLSLRPPTHAHLLGGQAHSGSTVGWHQDAAVRGVPPRVVKPRLATRRVLVTRAAAASTRQRTRKRPHTRTVASPLACLARVGARCRRCRPTVRSDPPPRARQYWGLDPPDCVNVWMALTDVTSAHGPALD